MESQRARTPHEVQRAHCGCRSSSTLPPIRTLTLAGIVLGSIGGGALLGAALTAFLMPASREELRRKLSQFLAAPEREEPGTPAGYDSGEHVLPDLDMPEHRESGYPWIAQPTSEDDAPRVTEDGREDAPGRVDGPRR